MYSNGPSLKYLFYLTTTNILAVVLINVSSVLVSLMYVDNVSMFYLFNILSSRFTTSTTGEKYTEKEEELREQEKGEERLFKGRVDLISLRDTPFNLFYQATSLGEVSSSGDKCSIDTLTYTSLIPAV